jgi:hypothetical protein
MDRDLKKTAYYFGISRPKLISLMREKGLLNDRRLPAFPTRDRAYLGVKDGQWFHPVHGMQYCQSLRVKQQGIPWLAEQLGLELPPVPADSRGVA